jgi:hypothetical protein
LLKENDKLKIDLGFNQYAQNKIPGVAALIDYATDKIINIKVDLCLMINGLINDFGKFKLYTYKYSNQEFKLIDRMFLRLILAKEFNKTFNFLSKESIELIKGILKKVASNDIEISNLTNNFVRYLLIKRIKIKDYLKPNEIMTNDIYLYSNHARRFEIVFNYLENEIYGYTESFGGSNTEIATNVKYEKIYKLIKNKI